MPAVPEPPVEPTGDARDAGGIREVNAVMDLALRIGEQLLSAGAGASDVSAAMSNVAWACGLRGFSADVTFTALTMSQPRAPDESPLIQIRQARYREDDYGDLPEGAQLIRDVVAGEIDREEAAARLNRVSSTRHARPRWMVTLA